MRKIESFSHSALVCGEDRREEAVGAPNAFASPLKLTCRPRRRLEVRRNAHVEDGVDLLAVGAAEPGDELVDIRFR